MSAHPNVKALRAFNRWRRGGPGPQPDPVEVGRVLEWAIAVCDAANKLANGKTRQPEIAYKRLEAAVNHE